MHSVIPACRHAEGTISSSRVRDVRRMASEDSDQLWPGFLAIHRLSDLRDCHKTLSGQVLARGYLLHATRELLEVASLGRTQWILLEERDDRLEQLVTPANDVLRQVLFVVVVP